MVVSAAMPQRPGLLLPIVFEKLKFVKNMDSENFLGLTAFFFSSVTSVPTLQ